MNMAIEGAPQGYLDDFAVRGNGENGKIGILLIHGFTGSPSSMRPWAEFFSARGYTVRVPRLPGHGTHWEDLNRVSWQEWPNRALTELIELNKTCEKVFIFGLSMGGGTTLYLAAHHGDKLAGMVLVNPMIHIPGLAVKFSPILARFRSHLPSVGNDIKRPNVSEYGYDALPTKGVLELGKLLKSARSTLGLVRSPLMLFHSTDDHVLPVSNTEIVLAEVGSERKQRIELVNSYHVATLDYDSDVIFENSLLFVQEISKIL
jgi:carboxylesterase